ncbi:MAG: hypothetical protein KDD33_05755 [Bdellovibrionales bacterium]|nr:hypothetical protein [Bdellovibrionales bacterium]
MNRLIVLMICFFSASAMAASEISTTMEKPSPYSLEPSFTYSTMGGGTLFISAALTTRVFSWLRLGVEGDLPTGNADGADIFMARVLGRIMLMESTDTIYLQGSASYGLFNATDLGSSYIEDLFAVEGMVGYSRAITQQWSLGGRMGIQLANSGAAAFGSPFETDSQQLFTRASAYGAYTF